MTPTTKLSSRERQVAAIFADLLWTVSGVLLCGLAVWALAPELI